MENDKGDNALFKGTGNSARSILPTLLDGLGEARLRSFSTGSHPRGEVPPQTMTRLERLGLPNDAHRGKNWDAFTHPNAPQAAFLEAAIALKRRIELLLAPPIPKFDGLALQSNLHSSSVQ